MPTRTQVIAALKARYDSQITGGESAQIEQAIAKLAIAQLVDASFSSGSGTTSGSGAVVGATESTLLAILAELQKHPTIQIVRDLVAGSNLIIHDLNLISPFTSIVTIVDNNTGSNVIASTSLHGSNSFVITSPISYPNIRITAKA